MRKSIGVIFSLGALLVSMATAAPASAATVATAVPAQVLGHAQLIRQSTPTTAATNLTEGSFANGDPAAITDDPALLQLELGGGTVAEFPRNTASTAPSSAHSGQGDSQEGAARSIRGLNAFDLGSTHGFIVEPPDQGLCANSRNVIEMVNLNFKVFDANLHALSGPIILETFFGDPIEGGFVPGTDVTVQGDPRCVWDPTTGRWFLSQLVIDFTKSTSVFQVAVSTTSNPLGSYNVYTIDNTDSSNPGCPCLGDQPTLGINSNALFVDTNEFGINTNEFNGAVIYTIDKEALADGAATANVVADFVGMTVPTPEWNSTTSCLAPIEGLFCWASIRPATSPSNDRRFGGVEYFLSALDFANVNDNRVAVWAMTNTGSIRSGSPDLHLSHNVIGSEPYVFPANFASQKAGTIPLGQSGWYSCEPHNPCAHPVAQPEGQIQTNDDQFESATFADGLVWGGLTTNMPNNPTQTGIAYFAIHPRLTSSGLNGSEIELQGYLTAKGNNVEYPTIAVTADGQGLISFTLSGPDFFPTSAYARINSDGAGRVRIAALGQSPQDGFTEYEFQQANDPLHFRFRPRWGDYSAAVAVGDRFVFASEYIQFPNCTLAVWTGDHTCGGTRQRAANWGTSVNTLGAGED